VARLLIANQFSLFLESPFPLPAYFVQSIRKKEVRLVPEAQSRVDAGVHAVSVDSAWDGSVCASFLSYFQFNKLEVINRQRGCLLA
jgi:hypothetical protein